MNETFKPEWGSHVASNEPMSSPPPDPVDKLMEVILNYPFHEQNRMIFQVRELLQKNRHHQLEQLYEQKTSIESVINTIEQSIKEMK